MDQDVSLTEGGARRVTWLGLLMVSALLGCSALGEVNAGYARSVTSTRSAAAVSVSGGIGETNGGAGYQARAKVGPSIGQLGVGVHLYALSGGKPQWPPPYIFGDAFFVRGGLDVLQAGSVTGRASFGMFSPFVDVGFLFRNPGITLSASSQYDVRFTSQKNDLWFGVSLGFGFAPNL